MTWNNTPHHHITSFSYFFLDCGVMDYIFVTTCHDQNFKFKKKIVNKNVLMSFEHDVHVYVFTMMYMFLNCICTRYIKACFHQGLNPFVETH
jgi:hypothetical protein